MPNPTHLVPRNIVHDLISGVTPGEDYETRDRTTALNWIESGAPLFRITRPATPNPHLCVYSVFLDDIRRTILLIDHIKAHCRLPPGGHVDPDEDPRTTALREAHEELGINGTFHSHFGDTAAFVSVTETRGDHSHTDVTLWFVLTADQETPITLDTREANALRWFPLDDPTEWSNPNRFDPALPRFRSKLLTALNPTETGRVRDDHLDA